MFPLQYVVMTTALISLPKKDTRSFWHPESQELILTAAAITTVFSFWNAVNIRPSILTDPGYNTQKEGIVHHMNLSLAVILGISTGFAAIYGKKGYLPATAAAGTGIIMYLWTKYELDRHDDVTYMLEDPTVAESMALDLRKRRDVVMD